jgi:glycosyltransferase involved in cell wall biosynthesis
MIQAGQSGRNPMARKLQQSNVPPPVNGTDKKLTVAHFMPWSGLGGVEIATLRLTEATREKFRHVAFCLDSAVALRDAFEKLGIETVTYTAPTPSLRHAGRYYKESLAVARQIRQAGVDIVHFSDEKAAHHNSLAALLARSRRVCHLRVSYPHLSLRSKLCLLPVQSFIFVSREAMESFALSLPAGKGRVIYDAIEVPAENMEERNESVRQELNIPQNCSVIGMVARVSAQKDYFTLASAAAVVLSRFPDTRFLIVGDNALVDLNRLHYEEVHKRLEELDIADKFIFTGHQSDVPKFIAAMDLCVLCTHREGFPLSILETMAMGKPVIATAVGGIPEVIQSGVTGYLHQHGNSKQLADAIMLLIEDPAKARLIGSTACEHVKENYSRQKFADEISIAYLDVLRR